MLIDVKYTLMAERAASLPTSLKKSKAHIILGIYVGVSKWENINQHQTPL